MTDPLETVLSQLDRWRHLPKYRLEQHVDVLFGFDAADRDWPQIQHRPEYTGCYPRVPDPPSNSWKVKPRWRQ